MMKYRLLLVDDHSIYLKLTKEFLEKHGYDVDTAVSGFEALKKIAKMPHGYALVVLDFIMDGKDGGEVAEEILRMYPHLLILITSSDQSREVLKRSWKSGAVDFVDKGVQPEEFLKVVETWCQKYGEALPAADKELKSENSKIIGSIGMIGTSKAMADVAKLALRYRSSRKNVLILGESGTGKEQIAKALHAGRPDSFRAVNCATYNGDGQLMESELFGYEKGAFTGAERNKKGVFEEAGSGTVFLDEIHTLSFRAQQKLLRALQEKTVRPVGSTREYPVNFRLIAASKPELESLVKAGEFLPDLYYRINVLRLDVPALRERPSDIAPLVQHFAKKHFEETGDKKVFLNGAIKVLKNYPWPGNVRELENTIERLCATLVGSQIGPNQLDTKFNDNHVEESFSTKHLAPKQAERERVLNILQTSRSRREAARRLGVASSTFHDYLKRLGIGKSPRRQEPKR